MRSMLFVPADSERKLAKAFASGADAIILDLEDSVAADRKSQGREMARAFVAAEKGKTGRPLLYVRINALDTNLWEDDLAAVMPSHPDGIMQPKTRSGEDVHRLSIALHHAEAANGHTGPETRIVPIVSELPLSILQMPSYIGSSTRLAAINWGMEDLSAELGAATYRDANGQITSPFRLARDLTLYTATAAGVQPLDAVFPDFRNLEGLQQECREAARDGFTGKAAIHPDQVAVINAAFTPSADEIEKASTIARLFAENTGAGVISYKGQMLDRPHLIRAERVLARAKAARLV
jgi:citrate lyase subunit beta/citryl-CoA lyase